MRIKFAPDKVSGVIDVGGGKIKLKYNFSGIGCDFPRQSGQSGWVEEEEETSTSVDNTLCVDLQNRNEHNNKIINRRFDTTIEHFWCVTRGELNSSTTTE